MSALNTRIDWVNTIAPTTFYLIATIAAGRSIVDTRLRAIGDQYGPDLRRQPVSATDWIKKWLARNETPSPAVAEIVAEVQREILVQIPQLSNELELRTRPLREQWDARGPGFLRQLTQQLPQLRDARPLQAIGLLPIRGGGGFALPAQHSIAMERLLTNSDDHITELLRLAWLITHVHLRDSLPLAANDIDRRATGLPLAALLLTLAIAADLDWLTIGPHSVDRAISQWELVPDSHRAQTATKAWHWLEQARELSGHDLVLKCSELTEGLSNA